MFFRKHVEEGLRRRGFTPERIAVVKQMHKLLYRQGLTLAVAQADIAQLISKNPDSAADIQLMLDFLAQSDRGIVRYAAG